MSDPFPPPFRLAGPRPRRASWFAFKPDDHRRERGTRFDTPTPTRRPVGGYGSDWYLFGTSVAIPNRYWQYHPGPGFNMQAEVRAIAASGPSGGLVTFNQTFYEYFDPAETEYSLNDLLSNAGNGPTVTVTGTYAAP